MCDKGCLNCLPRLFWLSAQCVIQMIHVKMASIEYLSLYRGGIYIWYRSINRFSRQRRSLYRIPPIPYPVLPRHMFIVSRRMVIPPNTMCLSYPCHILPRDVFILSLIALLYLSAVCVRVAPSFKNRPSPLRCGNLYLAAIEDAVCDDTVGRKPEHYHA